MPPLYFCWFSWNFCYFCVNLLNLSFDFLISCFLSLTSICLLLLFCCSLLFSQVQLFATPWTAACQASLSLTISQSLLRLMSIQPVMSSNHLILCYPLLLPPSIFSSIRVLMNWLFTSGGESIGASASASVLPMNIQD